MISELKNIFVKGKTVLDLADCGLTHIPDCIKKCGNLRVRKELKILLFFFRSFPSSFCSNFKHSVALLFFFLAFKFSRQ